MSLVSSRSLFNQCHPLYNDRQNLGNLVRPGISGWPQLIGVIAIIWLRNFILVVWYVGDISHWSYIRILLLTLKVN